VSTFLVFLAIVVAGAAGLLIAGPFRRRPQAEVPAANRNDGAGSPGAVDEPAAAGEPVTGQAPDRAAVGPSDDGHAPWQRGEVAALAGLTEPLPNLPPVLLPDRPRAVDIDQLRFSVAFRGYRMDQVDEVLDRLRAELAAREAEIRDLQAEAWRQQ
jgi:DivIVA domain-containing protein